MKVQSAKPQISTQVPQSFDDTQVDNEFTEGFSELIAILNAGGDTDAEASNEILSEISATTAPKDKGENDHADNDDLQNTMDSILFGLNPMVPQEIKQVEQQLDANKDETEKTGDKQNPIVLQGNSDNIASKEQLDLSALTKVGERSDKIDDHSPKAVNKDKLVNTETVAPAKAAMNEIEAQAMNAVKHANVATPLPRTVLQLDPNAMLQDKPSAALQELGKFINQHTSAALTEVRPAAATSQPTISYTQTLDKLSQLEPGMLITKSSVGIGAGLKDVYTANIKIHPPELGEVTATLKIDKNTAQLVLLTENDHVKSIVQAHLVQLKENFQKSDLYLTSVDVQTASGDSERQHKQPDGRQLPQMNQLVKDEEEKAQVPKSVSQRINSLIDTYV